MTVAAIEPLAIIGAGCRLPGRVDDPDGLWELLRGGGDGITEVPEARWSNDEYFSPEPAGPGFTCSRWGGFLDDVAGFDARFFRITPHEAARIDPQQRLLLELAWLALEDACIPAAELAGSKTGVVAGISSHDYFDLSTGRREQIDQYTGSGTSVSVAAGRLAFSFGFEGPALAVDTACSSSLVAVHLASSMLRGGECDLALAGGVHLMLTPVLRLIESRLGAQSPTGRCRSFDAAADGIVSGEGAGLVVLERLSDALANGHRIRALVLGSAVNQDGRSSGLTVPNARAQETVLRSALGCAGIDASRVGYVEAHGSATPIGDPIEAEALSAVYGGGRPADAPLPIGSIKSNVGHLGAAAGIAGLLKAMLALEHGRIPPQPHCSQPTPAVDWERAGLRVATEELPLQATAAGPVAGVSGFGFSGTNAHVLLERAPDGAPEPAGTPTAGRPHLLALSAGDGPALHATVARLRDHIASHRAPLASVAKTANLGRSHLATRTTFVAGTLEQLDGALQRFEGPVEPIARPPRIGFLCPGQGSQHGDMAGELLDTDAGFRAAIARCDELLSGQIPRKLADLLRAPDDDPDLRRTGIAQPLLVGLGYALDEYWKAAGVRPGWVAGHSAGEITAAYVAGLLSLPDALSLAVARGRLMEGMTQDGAIALVSCERAVLDEVLARHRQGVVIAAFNGPRRWALSGQHSLVADCVGELARAGASVRQLPISLAGHSEAMLPIAPGLKAAAAALSFQRPSCRFVSTLTGRIEDETPARPEYWAQEVLAPVRFHEAVDAMIEDGCDVLLELGPGASLVSMAADWVTDRPMLTSLKRDESPEEHLLGGLGELYRRGVAVDWRAPALDRGGSFVALPGYPFQRSPCWLPAAAPRFAAPAATVAGERPHPLLGHEHSTVLGQPGQTLYEHALSVSTPAYLADHGVGGQRVLPAAAFVEMLLAAARRRWPAGAIRLSDITFDRALTLGEEPVAVQTLLEQLEGESLRARVFSSPASAGWVAHCEARVERAPREPDDPPPAWPVDAPVSSERSAAVIAEHYERVAAGGVTLGPSFRAIAALEPDASGGTVRVLLPASVGSAHAYCVHPVMLDAALQSVSPALDVAGDGRAYVPTRIDALTFSAAAGPELVGHVVRRPGEDVVIDAELREPDGAAIAVVSGVHMRSVPISALGAGGSGPAPRLYELTWRPAPASPGGERGAAGAEVLILSDGDEHVEALGRALQERGCTVTTRAGDGEPRAVVLIGAVEQMLGKLQSVIDAGAAEPPTLWLLTTGARAVAAGDRVDGLEQAPAWGLGLVLGREHPELRCRLVDLDPQALEQSLAAAASDLVASLDEGPSAVSPREDRLAYRGTRRLVERVATLDVPAPARARLELDPEAAYVITGGLSGVGLATAEWLAERGAGHLTLIGRSAPDAEAAGRVEALRELGTDVVARSGDVSDERRLAAILDEVRGRGRPLRGVVHSAGIVRDGVISGQSREEFAAVLRPKVQGSLLLHRLTREDPLDLFVLYSSAVVLLGPPGQSAHTAANAFLGSLAHHRKAAGLPALAVDWGGWDRVGARSVRDPRGRMDAAGMGLIARACGFEALELLILAGATQAAVLPIDWARFCARFGASALYAEVTADAQAAPATARGDMATTLLALPAAQRREALAAQVATTIAAGIGLPDADALDRSQGLTEIGVDSLMAVELRNRLSSLLGRPLRSTLLLDFPTVDGLTDFLGTEILGLWPGPGSEQPGDGTTNGDSPDLGSLSVEELDDVIDQELMAWQSRRQA